MSIYTPIDIQGCADFAKERSKALAHCRFWLRLISFGGAIVFALFNFEWWQALLVLLSEGFGSVLEGLSKAWFGRHRKWRGAGLICDAFGIAVPPELHSEIEQELGVKGLETVKERKRSEDNPYYASLSPWGIQRLTENVHESVHFSARLSQESHRQLKIWPVIWAIIGLILFIFGPQIEKSHWGSLSLFMTFMLLMFSDKVKNYFEYRKAESEFRAIELLTDKTNQPLQSTPDILRILADYVLISALNPPIDSVLFHRNRDRLKSSWNSRNIKRINPTETA